MRQSLSGIFSEALQTGGSTGSEEPGPARGDPCVPIRRFRQVAFAAGCPPPAVRAGSDEFHLGGARVTSPGEHASVTLCAILCAIPCDCGRGRRERDPGGRMCWRKDCPSARRNPAGLTCRFSGLVQWPGSFRTWFGGLVSVTRRGAGERMRRGEYLGGMLWGRSRRTTSTPQSGRRRPTPRRPCRVCRQ